jgi:type I restriction enzyme S subunit
MGKLVPQDQTDEPAAVLLSRVNANSKGSAAEPLVAPLEDDEGQPMALPAGWSWASFGRICAIKSDLVRPEDFMDSQQLAPDCIEKGTGRIIERRTVRQSGVRGPNSRFVAGQIVYSKIRPSLSKVVLVDFDGLCSADMYPIDSFISSSYQLRVMLSEVFLRQVRLAENRVKMPKLNQDSLNAFVVPIPPLPEQHRIVAKVDELMALCDQLKDQLTEARQQHAQLATALVEQAVA